MTRLSHDQVAELLGVYALDAVDADERDAVDEHLAGCPRCRAELREHLEVASILGDEGAPAPAGIWHRIADEIDDGGASPVLPPLDLGAVRSSRGERPADAGPARPRRRPRLLAAAAAVVVALGLGSMGAVIATQQSRLDDMEDEMASVMIDPDAEVVQLVDAEGVAYAAALLGEDGQAAIVSTALSPLPDGRAYQLWAVGPDGPVSLAVLGAAPTVVPFRVSAGAPMVLAITEEPATGSPAPTSDPMVTGEISL